MVTLVASVLLGMLYSLIFHFSAQDGGESGSLSGMISEKCVECADWLSGSGWNEAEKAELLAGYTKGGGKLLVAAGPFVARLVESS